MRLHKIHYNLSFSLHKAFWHNSRLATLHVPSGVTFKSYRPIIVYCLGSIRILFYVPKQVLELLSLMTSSMASYHFDEWDTSISAFIQRLNIWWDNCSAWILGLNIRSHFSSSLISWHTLLPQIIPSIVKMEYLQAFIWV